MKKRLLTWNGGCAYDITLMKVYDVERGVDLDVELDPYYLNKLMFKDDAGHARDVSLGTWADVVETEVDMSSEEHTGGSSSYYDLKLGSTTIKCLDIIEGLDMSYNEGNILKAVWRIAAAKQGKKKKGNNMYYDSEKIVFFGERLLEEHKEDV